MTRRGVGLALTVLLVGLLLLEGLGPSDVRAAATNPVTGTVTGPTVLATQSTKTYTINGTGGPAFASNGTQVGNLTAYLSLSAPNMTGLSISPGDGKIVNGIPVSTLLEVGSAAEVVTILVMLSSVYLHQNQSINFSYTVNVVVPYTVRATIVNGASTTVLSFPVKVLLDGTPVGTVTVPSLTPGGSYNLSFEYPTLGLSSGDHTFSISLAQEHGLVTFANGATVYSSTFYVTGPAPNYTLWYIVGIVAFLGVLFIFVTRVAARRRGALRR
jgi:archaellum component FlaF (FlaF/FlaG flagellin family)